MKNFASQFPLYFLLAISNFLSFFLLLLLGKMITLLSSVPRLNIKKNWIGRRVKRQEELLHSKVEDNL